MKRKRYKHSVLLACSALAAWESVYGMDAQNSSASKRIIEVKLSDYVCCKYEREITLEAIAFKELRAEINCKRDWLKKRDLTDEDKQNLRAELKCLEKLLHLIIKNIFGVNSSTPNTTQGVVEKEFSDTSNTDVTAQAKQVEAWRFLRAIRENDAAGLRRLIRTGNEGETRSIWFLEKAVAEGKVEQLDLLINAGAGIHQSIDGQLTLANLAVQKQQWRALNCLLEHGVEPPTFAPEEIQELLIISAEIGGLALMKHLVEYQNVDINGQNGCGKTALHWACGKNHLDVVKYLIEKGAVVDKQDRAGNTPMCYVRSPDVWRALAAAVGTPIGIHPPLFPPLQYDIEFKKR